MTAGHPVPDPVLLREKMVQQHVIDRGVTDARVVAAMRAVPRHLFVDEALAARAYTDQPLPIGGRQTISRPSTVALMSELLAPEPEHRVLEIGTGSGYQAAVLSLLCREVDTVERLPLLVQRARKTFARLGIRNVRVFQGDGSVGGVRASYPRIIVTAGAPRFPEALFEQLEEGGRLVAPVADASGGERLQLVERVDGRPRVRASAACAFVPLIGERGHAEPEPPAWT